MNNGKATYEEAVDLLRDDKNYYGEIGRKYLSYSNIITLLKDPQSFHRPKEQTLAMLQGSYLHTAILEPHKLDNFTIVDLNSRNAKAYKEALEESGEERLLLSKEVVELDLLVNAIISNTDWCEMLSADENLFEQPGIGEIMGMTDYEPDSVALAATKGTSKGKYVLSGMVKNEDRIVGQGAIFDIPVKSGRVVAFTFNPLHRFLNHHDAPLLWNVLMNWDVKPEK